MSLIPRSFDNTSRLLDQHFGHGMNVEDLLASMSMSPMFSPHYFRPWRSFNRSASHHDAGSTINVDSNKFQVSLDVQQFSPDEIIVKTASGYIIVEGKHEEKQDEHGLISRHFIRKYALPGGYRPEDVTSSLSSDGLLTITAPKIASVEEVERLVPIQNTGAIKATTETA